MTVKQQELEAETALITEMVEQMISENARKTQDQSEYNRKRNALVERFNIAKKTGQGQCRADRTAGKEKCCGAFSRYSAKHGCTYNGIFR